MRLVVDTNVIISALVKNSASRKIIVYSTFHLFTPSFTLEELRLHLDEICGKKGIDNEESLRVLNILFKYINVIDFDFYVSKIERAKRIIGNVDENDVPFIALALSFDNGGIWSNDRHFLRQKEIKIWRTEDI